MLRMISNIDPAKSAIASILSAIIGSISKYLTSVEVPTFIGMITVDTALQRLAWTIAILAGAVAVVNGTKNWFKNNKNNKNDARTIHKKVPAGSKKS